MTRRDAGAAPSVASSDAELAAALEAAAGSPEAMRQCVLSLRRTARAALDARVHRVLVGKGHEARASCARELCAGLSDVSVGELLQIVALGRKDAVIDVFDGALVGRVWCSAGEIVDARSGRLEGESAAYRVLAAERGELCADFRSVRRARSVQASMPALMLEAARRKDECAVLEARLGGARGAYFAAATAASTGRNGVDAALLTAFAGGARLDAVRATVALDDLALLQSIHSLVERGLLVAGQGSPNQSPPNQAASGDDTLKRGTPNHGALAAAAPIGVASRASMPLPAPLLRHRPSPRAIAALLAFTAGALSIAGLVDSRAEPELPVDTTRAPEPTAATEEPPLEATTPTAQPSAPAAVSTSEPRDTTPPDSTYPVHVVADPAQAALWLDGDRIAAGELSIILLHNGQTHELRVTSPRHHPQTFLFRDAPPPRAIRLDPLSDDDEPPLEGPPPPDRQHSQSKPTLLESDTRAASLARFRASRRGPAGKPAMGLAALARRNDPRW